MSYKLYLRPREGGLKDTDFGTYFRRRDRYEVDGSQANYRNYRPKVEFSFKYAPVFLGLNDSVDRVRFPVTFSMDYMRASCFALEAHFELAWFVKTFDLLVHDPQAGGMGTGAYRRDGLLSGWNRGNEAACRATLARTTDMFVLPRAKLQAVWRWNYAAPMIQDAIGSSCSVGDIELVRVHGEPTSLAIWVDGAEIAIPPAEYFIVLRTKRLLPRFSFFGPRFVKTMVKAELVRAILERYRVTHRRGVDYVDYWTPHGVPRKPYWVPPPQDIVDQIAALPTIEPKFEHPGYHEPILDAELVEAALRK